jgi:tetratricopeptide (TPR) repeat protein
LGTIAETTGKNTRALKEALKYYSKAIRFANRRYARAYLRRAMVYVKLKNYLRAAMDLRRAKTLDEDLVDPLIIKTIMGKIRQTK